MERRRFPYLFLILFCCMFLLSGCQQTSKTGTEIVPQTEDAKTEESSKEENGAVGTEAMPHTKVSEDDSETKKKSGTAEDSKTDTEDIAEAEETSQKENSSAGKESIPQTDGKNDVSEESSSMSENDVLRMYVLDVGQGSAALFENEGHYLLVDGGDRDTSSYVVSFLKNLGIEELDYCIATHFDSDHISGLVGCLNVFPIQCLIAPDYEADTKTYESLMKYAGQQGLTPVHPSVGTEYELGDAAFTILSPNDSQYTDENDFSIGIRMVYGDISFLVAGDATALSEYEMLENGLELSSDVYIVNHHGSDSSSSEGFLKAVSPKVAIISCGLNNSYGHPSQQTMDRLLGLGVELYRTDLQGNITAECDGTDIRFSVDPCKDFSSGKVLKGRQEDALEEDGSVTLSSQGKDKDSSGAQQEHYILNTNTKVFHLPSCASVSRMSEKNKQDFYGTMEEAKSQGYRPCQNCLEGY